MDYIDYSFADEGRTLALECRLADGWRKHASTYCFSEGMLMDWKFDNRCRVSVSVFPRPSGLFDAAKEWPTIEARNGRTCGIRYSVQTGKMGIRVPLLVLPAAEMKDTLPDGNIPNFELPWGVTENRKLSLFILEQEMAFHDGISYELQFLWVLQPKPLVRGPTMIDWCRRFYPGGLPTLGKNR